jgi:hypothetical protein
LLARGYWISAANTLILAKLVGLGSTAFVYDTTTDASPRTRQAGTGRANPFNSCSPVGSSSNKPPSKFCVASLIKTVSGAARKRRFFLYTAEAKLMLGSSRFVALSALQKPQLDRLWRLHI